MLAQAILQNPLAASDPALVVPPPTSTTTSVRLLVSHNLMGSIIGKGGAKIKEIQDASGVRMVASKEMLPHSTERIVEVQGSPESIRTAVNEIGKCLMDDWERASGTVLYQPGTVGPDGVTPTAFSGGVLTGGFGVGQYPGTGGGGGRRGAYGTGSGYRRHSNGAEATMGGGARIDGGGARNEGLGGRSRENSAAAAAANDPSLRTQNISIPADMVGVSLDPRRRALDSLLMTVGPSASSASSGPRSTRSAGFRAPRSASQRRRTTTRASGCSPSPARPRRTKRPSSCSTTSSVRLANSIDCRDWDLIMVAESEKERRVNSVQEGDQ